jgi:23S rRNA (pseudouridine1915-N3)-methyltransferase
MRIELILNGKTEDKYVEEGFALYEKRLKHYIQFATLAIASPKVPKSASPQKIMELEAELMEKQFDVDDYVVLLDEHGKEPTSVEFAAYLQKRMNAGIKKLVFVVGGPYGFDERIKNRSNDKLALSKLTFPHQLVRLVFIEQLYRAFTILRNEPYHHA